jgi:hypothetical protein
LDFDTSSWDYVEIFDMRSDEEVYFHLHGAQDDPADTHQIAREYALQSGRYILSVDTNDRDGSWLGSKTALEIDARGNLVAPWKMLLLGQ